MNQPNFASAALLALVLTACNQNASDNIAIDNGVAAPTPDVTAPADVATASEMPAAKPENTAVTAANNDATPAKLPTSIPAQFHGRWGLTKADCTSTQGDAKGLLTINDARLTFYESKGTLDKVLGATATSFDANYGFSGEGQTWERVERLKRVNGKLFRRTDAAAGQEPPVNLTYTRCGEWR